MRTKSFYFPSEKKAELDVEYDRDSNIVSVLAYIPYLDLWADCTEAILNRPVLRSQIEQEIASLDWEDPNDYEDWACSAVREFAKREVKRA